MKKRPAQPDQRRGFSRARPRILFVTGTDTGVGKTVVTALLLHHLRSGGMRANALKPFCSGSRADARLLHDLQAGELSLDEINPFYFDEPLAPLIAARLRRREIKIPAVLTQIAEVAKKLGANGSSKSESILLIEGSGGLLVPLAENFSVLDLVCELGCEVLVVGRNRLGTINHTLLTVQALQARRADRNTGAALSAQMPLGVALVDVGKVDPSASTNAQIVAELIAPVPVFTLPFFAAGCGTPGKIKRAARQCGSTLARLLERREAA